MTNLPMHRLLLAALGVCGLTTSAAGCATMSGSDGEAREPSRQRAEADRTPATARRAERDPASRSAAETRENEQPPSEPPAAGVGTGVDARERQMTALVAEGGGVDPSELGYFMDVHEASLRQATSGTDISMGRDGNRFQLTVAGSACFADGSDELASSIRPAFGSLAGVLAEFDKTLVTVVARAAERELSKRRATAVARYLQGRGVAEGRLVAIGRTADDAASPVEIVVEPVLD